MTFPNPLADPRPRRRLLAKAIGIPLFLFLFCLAPRAWMAVRLESICPDGVFYIQKAEHLLHHDQPHASSPLYDLNVFPVVLSWLYRAGLDWETAARVWGVFASSLAVLPLFGWVRRMFDDRIAVLACLLYGAQPKLIEWSPEFVREPTFWLLMTTAIFCTWRAVTEVRIPWFIAAGIATFLAANTRLEGWFLLVPFALWILWRWWALEQARWQLAGGAVAFLACYPLVLAMLVNVYGYERWEWGSIGRMTKAREWATSFFACGASATNRAATTTPAASTPMTSVVMDAADSDAPSDANRTEAMRAKAMRVTCVAMEKWGRAFSPAFGVLVLLGTLRWWRVWIGRDHAALLIYTLITAAAIWLHASVTMASSTRYVMPLVILSTPCAALGLMLICRTIASVINRIAPRASVVPYTMASLLLVAVIIAGNVDALSSNMDDRAAKADLGRWIRETSGANRVVVGSASWQSPIAYHAGAQYHAIAGPCISNRSDAAKRLRTLCQEQRPDFVVLCRYHEAEWLDRLVQTAGECGAQAIDPMRLPLRCRDQVVVLTARKPNTTAAGTHTAGLPKKPAGGKPN